MNILTRLFGVAGRPGARSGSSAYLALPSGRCSEVRLETDRLLLRPYRSSDFEGCFAMSSDPDAFRFSERGPMDRGEAWNRLLRHVGHWALTGWGVFAVIEKGTGRFAGEAGFSDFRRQLGPDFDGFPEGSLSIGAWARGLGYGTEAAAAVLAWIGRERSQERTVALIHAHNAKSLHIAGKLGYRAFDRRDYRGYPAVLVERLLEPALKVVR